MLALISSIRRSEEYGGGRNDVDMDEAGPGFTLPANIGDLDPAITELYWGRCCLAGMNFWAQFQHRYITFGELFSVAVKALSRIYLPRVC